MRRTPMTATVRLAGLCAGLGLITLLSACGERNQELQVTKMDEQPWADRSGYAAGTWKAGIQRDWEQQIQARHQNQNEYARTGGATPRP